MWAGVVLAALWTTPTPAQGKFGGPICVSANGRFLVEADGEPFFWLGDTAWSIVMRLTREEADEYLKDRAAKGFNVIQAVAVGGPLDFLETPNRYGELPLIDRDYKRPNPKYFEHVDWVVARASHYGLRVAMLPVWGLQQVTLDKSLDAATAEGFGQWMADRYRDAGVIWVLGGDTTPMWRTKRNPSPNERSNLIGPMAVSVDDARPIFDAMAVGLIRGDGGDPFITFHPTHLSFSGTAPPRTSLYFHDRNWLDMNMLQTSHFIDPSAYMKFMGADFSWRAPYNYEPITEEYRSSPVRPVLDGEPRFEDLVIDLDKKASKGYWSGDDARNAAYQALFAGAAGHTYGNHSIWQYIDPKQKRLYQLPREGVDWRLAMTRPSNSQMQHAKALFLSRPYFTRIPDQSIVVSSHGEGASYISATRDKGGSYVFVYLPRGQSVTVNMTKIAGARALGWWFDPRSGGATRIADSFATNGYATFVAPGEGIGQDWVLVLDDEGRHFGAPGKSAEFRPERDRTCASVQKLSTN